MKMSRQKFMYQFTHTESKPSKTRMGEEAEDDNDSFGWSNVFLILKTLPSAESEIILCFRSMQIDNDIVLSWFCGCDASGGNEMRMKCAILR
jgi:hypothetical protein